MGNEYRTKSPQHWTTGWWFDHYICWVQHANQNNFPLICLCNFVSLISNSICLALLIRVVWTYKCRIHLPNLERGCDISLNSIVEYEQSSSSINCPCWINSWCYTCSSTLSKAFNYRMVHLNYNNKDLSPLINVDDMHVRHVLIILNKAQLTNILKDNFSPSSTGTTLP